MTMDVIPGGRLKIRPAKWGGPHRGRTHPHLLPLQFGDGKKLVCLSFYHAPWVEIVVKFDSTLPLDLPDSERFKQYEGKRSFRDYLDEIYEVCRENIKINRSWDRVIENGATWCYE